MSQLTAPLGSVYYHSLYVIYNLICSLYFTDDLYTWEWEDEHSHWNPYLPDAVISLEEAHSGGEKSVALSAMGRNYTVDLKKLVQVNDDTGVERKVRRQKTGEIKLYYSSECPTFLEGFLQNNFQIWTGG